MNTKSSNYSPDVNKTAELAFGQIAEIRRPNEMPTTPCMKTMANSGHIGPLTGILNITKATVRTNSSWNMRTFSCVMKCDRNTSRPEAPVDKQRSSSPLSWSLISRYAVNNIDERNTMATI